MRRVKRGTFGNAGRCSRTKIERRRASVRRMAIPRACNVTKARLSRHVSIILCQIVCRCRGTTSCSFLGPLALAHRNLCVTASIEILSRSWVVHLSPRPSFRTHFCLRIVPLFSRLQFRAALYVRVLGVVCSPMVEEFV